MNAHLYSLIKIALFQFFKKDKYKYLIDESVIELSRQQKIKLLGTKDKQEQFISNFCFTSFGESHIYKICSVNYKDPLPYYKEPAKLPNKVESQILDLWLIRYQWKYCYVASNRESLEKWLKNAIVEAVGLLSRTNWGHYDLIALKNRIYKRFEEYDTAFIKYSSHETKYSFTFAEEIVKHIFNNSEINNVGLLMAINIHFESAILAYIQSYSDFDIQGDSKTDPI
jgi:hypothetical protein